MKPMLHYLVILVGLITPAILADEIAFQKINEYYIGGSDQETLYDIVIFPDSFFTLWHYVSSEQFVSYAYLVKIDRAQVPHSLSEYWASPFPAYAYNHLWLLSYQRDIIYIAPEKRLLDRIIPIGTDIYLPDNNNESHYFKQDGAYKGLIPNPEPVKNIINSSIILGNKSVSFPFLLQGITYKRAVFLDKTLLLLSDFEYSSVGIDDLAENGEKSGSANVCVQKQGMGQ